jgi:nitronate monooxygenase
MDRRLAPYRRELGLPEETGPQPAPPPPFGPQALELVLALGPPVVSFHFGLPEPRALTAIQDAGIVVLSTATTVAEARILEDRGVDAIVAQGFEAGGHRGTFASDFADAQIGTLALVPQIVAAVSVPVIAAGGIVDGRGIAAALLLGAAAAQLGTAFLGCPEAQLDPLYRRTLSDPAAAARTRVTTLFSGRPARALVNRLVEELADLEGKTPDFPLQRFHTRAAGRGGRARGSADFQRLCGPASPPPACGAMPGRRALPHPRPRDIRSPRAQAPGGDHSRTRAGQAAARRTCVVETARWPRREAHGDVPGASVPTS